MKALTIRQPWASLIATGVKTIETRSWSTKHRGTIAIHAGAHRPAQLTTVGHDWCVAETFLGGGALELQHFADGVAGAPAAIPLPLGAVLATAQLVDCVPINPQVGHEHEEYDPPDDHIYTTVDGRALYRQQVIGDPSNPRNVVPTDLTDQLPLGDFTAGRWAWILYDIASTQVRCPVCLGQHPDGLPIAETGFYRGLEACPPCRGMGRRDPMPATGRLGLWDWDPAKTA